MIADFRGRVRNQLFESREAAFPEDFCDSSFAKVDFFRV